MNLSDHLAASLTSDMLALIRLVKADAENAGLSPLHHRRFRPGPVA